MGVVRKTDKISKELVKKTIFDAFINAFQDLIKTNKPIMLHVVYTDKLYAHLLGTVMVKFGDANGKKIFEACYYYTNDEYDLLSGSWNFFYEQSPELDITEKWFYKQYAEMLADLVYEKAYEGQVSIKMNKFIKMVNDFDYPVELTLENG